MTRIYEAIFPRVARCRRCGGDAMFRPLHPDRQTHLWMCQRCDAPERYREVELKFAPAADPWAARSNPARNTPPDD